MRRSTRPIPSALLAATFLASLGAACGGDDEGSAIDAPAPAIDARPPIDAAPPIDATVDAFIAPVNGCTPALAEDYTGAATLREITFGGVEYTPRCMRIARDQLVTFVGDFVAHPLRAGVIEMGVATEQPGGPITATTLGTDATFTFPTVGVYPYYCLSHIALNMSGVIYVQ